eukprot:CAMPEP_0201680390 /NCGR_PEP_ID=MMETSP0494-20130426/50574_1 /ASSEMBLY_ACC=CAM_ASM_000839 /TAXON_ID=420259 /ORGANISM="Thalassiosira gravida, Strain GMp14c1" /LENGTH=554 /DNA_ID=CAMNT_0048164109 /DNA_START=80 /DNA_END=1743 /DNA_ORIENTATION=-
MAKKSILKRSKTTATLPTASSSSSSSGSITGSRRTTANTKKRKNSPLHRFLRSKSAPPIGSNDDDDGGQTQSTRSEDRSPSTSRSRTGLSSRHGGRSTPRNKATTATATAEADDGTPSSSTYRDLQRVLKMIRDERHLAAYELYCNAKGRVEEARKAASEATAESDGMANNGTKRRNKFRWKGAQEEGDGDGDGDGDGEKKRAKGGRQFKRGGEEVTRENDDRDEKAWQCLQERREEFQALENRANLFKSAKENLSTDDDWIHAKGVGSLSGGGEEVTRESDDRDEKAWQCLQERREEFQALENRANLFKSAKENLSTDDDWIHAQTLFGVTTSYRREPNSSLSVKIEGELHGIPLFEQLVVLREADLYSHWAPFLSHSKKLAQLDKLDLVAWYVVGVPLFGVTRDAVYRAVGCDCMREEGGVLLVAVGLRDGEEDGVRNGWKDGAGADGGNTGGDGSGDDVDEHGDANGGTERGDRRPPPPIAESDSNLVDAKRSSFLARDEILSTLEIPPVPQGMGRGRMTIRNFAASIDILGPTSARTKMVVNVDPNLQLV